MQKHEKLMKQKPGKALWTLAVPSVVMQLVDEANSVIDAVFLGRFFGPDAVASMAIVFPFMLILIAIGAIFSTGAMILIGKKLGAKSIREANGIFMSAGAILVLISTVLGILAFLAVPGFLSLYTVGEATHAFAKLYMQAIALALPIMTLSSYFNEVIYTEGHAKVSLGLMLLQLFLNVALNYIIIGVLKVGVLGIVVATIVTMLLQLLIMAAYIQSKHMSLSFKLEAIHIDQAFFSAVVPLGMPAFISMMLLSVTLGIESNVIAGFGQAALSVQTITGYLFSVSSSIATGVLSAALVLMSYAVGAKDEGRFRRLLTLALIAVVTAVILMNAPLVMASQTVVRLFTDAAPVRALIRTPALIYGLSAPFIFGTNVYLYVMTLIDMEKLATRIFALQQLGLFLPLLFILKNQGFVFAVSAQPLAELIGGIITLTLLPKFYGKIKEAFLV